MIVLGLLAFFVPKSWADDRVNLTPIPKSMTVQDGSLALPAEFKIDVRQLGDTVLNEVNKFVVSLEKATGMKIQQTEQGTDALIQVRLNPEIVNPEGYTLNITGQGIEVEASHCGGFFYAFQTIKKMLPANVMAEVNDPSVTDYRLPLLQIVDEPRFGYRGFMLDVARHFFDVDQVKRVMDMMACYKMNKLHLHLSDDQGFRVEITKYPRLNTISSIRDDSYSTDFGGSGVRFHTYKPYGPYYYTKEQIRDLVAYAQKLHIDIIPEIDMPGHFGAAMAAYPEFSCEPNVRHPIISDESPTPTIPNVANPKTLQFAKDILSEIMDLFPYPYIHIGGDECDASHWERNEECRVFMQKMNFQHVRALQSYFTKEMADFVATRGYKLLAWNEIITATGADLSMIQSTGANIVCWTGAEAAAQKAASLGLSNILAPQPTYYINRKQSADPSEPTGPGNGNETLEAVYNYAPANNVGSDKLSYYKGVQACMWTEYISAEKHLEYMAFPRLMAVAESGWSPASKKNFEDFRQRMSQDTVMFNYRDYEYGRHYLNTSQQEMVMPEVSTNEKMHWHRLMTLATDAERTGRCMTLLHEGSEPVTAGYGQVNMLWSSVPVEETDEENKYQLWAIKESPTEPGKYALICQALPEGSVNPQPTATTTSGRWTYDPDGLHYNFVLSDSRYYGQQDGKYYYAIRSDAYTNYWMNLSMSGQHLAINVYTNPTDSKAGLWHFISQEVDWDQTIAALRHEAQTLLNGAAYYTEEALPGRFSQTAGSALTALLQDGTFEDDAQKQQYAEELEEAVEQFKLSLGLPEDGQQIRITNALEKNTTLTDDDTNLLGTSTDHWGKDLWIVSKDPSVPDTYFLKNLNSSKFISGTASPLSLSDEGAAVTFVFDWAHKDFQIMSQGDKAWFPISKASAKDAGKVYTGGIRAQDAAWTLEPAWQVTYQCCDSTGAVFATRYQSVSADSSYTFAAPQLSGWAFVRFENGETLPAVEQMTENKTVKVFYKREECQVTLVCRDRYGNRIGGRVQTYPYQAQVELSFPELEFYTFAGSDPQELLPFAIGQDTVINLVYDTEAYNGFWELGDPVTEVEDGRQYVFYNATTVDQRSGFLHVDASGVIKTDDGQICGLPAYVWSLQASGNAYEVHNAAGRSMPALNSGNEISVSDTPGLFTFAYNSGSWQVRDQNGLYWNGNVGSLTGWSDAHPYQIYEFVPYLLFQVTVNYLDEEGQALREPITEYVRAGYSYTPIIPEFDRYTFSGLSENAARLERVDSHLTVDVIYTTEPATGIGSVQTDAPKNGKIYNLSGQEVTNPQRGIYIQNGNKVVIR